MRAQDVLPDDANEARVDGLTIRKGTIGAFLNNARVWSDTAASEADRRAAERDILEAVPALRAVGLFAVMEIRDAELAALVAKAGDEWP